jgi:hypothetical protein
MPHGESTDWYLPPNGLHTERDEVRDEQASWSTHTEVPQKGSYGDRFTQLRARDHKIT